MKIETIQDIPVILRVMLFVGIIVLGNGVVYEMILNCENQIPTWLPPLIYVFLNVSMILAEFPIIFPEFKEYFK